MGKGFLGRDFWDKEFGGCAGCRHKSEDGSYKNYCDKYPNGKPEEVINKEAKCSKYEEVRNWVELHKDEKLTFTPDGDSCKICKDCKFIDKTVGYYANCCEKYPNIGDKPDEITNWCKFYEKGKRYDDM